MSNPNRSIRTSDYMMGSDWLDNADWQRVLCMIHLWSVHVYDGGGSITVIALTANDYSSWNESECS